MPPADDDSLGLADAASLPADLQNRIAREQRERHPAERSSGAVEEHDLVFAGSQMSSREDTATVRRGRQGAG
jgi:hypothetical protein